MSQIPVIQIHTNEIAGRLQNIATCLFKDENISDQWKHEIMKKVDLMRDVNADLVDDILNAVNNSTIQNF